MKKVVTIVGARPQFIKMAPVSRMLGKNGNFHEVTVHTGQHYDTAMSAVFFDELEIGLPKYNLDVGSGSHAQQTGEIMKRLEPVLLEEKPDVIIIYGDTNSTLAAALTGVKLHIPIAHIEAGLRSFNRRMPEEINRVVADSLAGVLFCPTLQSIENLKREGITDHVFHVGDVMFDAAIQFTEKARQKSVILNTLALEPKRYLLATIHRAENTDDPVRLRNILAAFDIIARDHTIIMPLHPRTKKMIAEFRLQQFLSIIRCIEPVGFLDMICLENNASLIVTDSGGMQKESYFYKVPCVTLRDETEWIETVKSGWNRLVNAQLPESIVQGINKALSEKPGKEIIHDYGKGNAAELIVEELNNFCE